VYYAHLMYHNCEVKEIQQECISTYNKE
jgi:hypothetical protein